MKNCKNDNKTIELKLPEEFSDMLTEVLKKGAQKLLKEAIMLEVAEYIEKNKKLTDEQGHRLIVRNGFMPEREIVTGLGKMEIKQPRVNDKREGEKFTSNILPRYLKRTPSIDNLLPTLYLRGISTSQFPEALKAILGDGVSGLSANTIVRLKSKWENEYDEWRKRDLSDKRYVYFWVDGIYFNVRLESIENRKQCILVVIGATEEGKKEIIAVSDGYRESSESWGGIFKELKNRGLSEGPKIIIGDGSLGTWKAAEEEFPESRHQLCWVHKTFNVLDKMPKSIHERVKANIHDIYLAPTKEEALKAYSDFMNLYDAKYPGACQSIERNKEALLTFYDFPALHWQHIRTTNVIESSFASVRLRTHKTKGMGQYL